MSKFAEKVKANYEAGYWKKPALQVLVRKGMLTTDEYEDITGESYPG